MSVRNANYYLVTPSCSAALVELSEQAAQELSKGSIAIGRVAELEAKVAELEVRGRRVETEKVKAEEALHKEKRRSRIVVCRVLFALFVTCLLFRARGLHQGQ